MDLPEEIPSALLKQAIPVAGADSDAEEFGWRAEDALRVAEALRGTKIAIMGGDVYRTEPWGVTPSYENWACGVLPGETASEFAQRTQEVARAKIMGLSDDGSDDQLFVLTFSGQDDAA